MVWQPVFEDRGVEALMFNARAVIQAAVASGAREWAGAGVDGTGQPLPDFKTYQFSRTKEADIDVDVELFPVCTVMPAREQPDSLTRDFTVIQDHELIIEVSTINDDPEKCTLEIVRFSAMMRQIFYRSWKDDPRVLLDGYEGRGPASLEISPTVYQVISLSSANSYIHTSSQRLIVKFDQVEIGAQP